jgi:hypothetical protein
VTDSYHEVRFSIMFSSGFTGGETVPARSGEDGKLFQVISGDERWEDSGVDEIEDFRHG